MGEHSNRVYIWIITFSITVGSSALSTNKLVLAGGPLLLPFKIISIHQQSVKPTNLEMVFINY